MSIRATEYALQCLEDDDELVGSTRLVLMLLAARANSQTGITYTGGWLEATTGYSDSTLWRALAQLRESGIVALDDRPGKAIRVRFPVVSKLSTPLAPARQVSSSHPSRWRDRPLAPARPVSGSVSGIENARDDHDSVCACDATGWVHDPATRTVSPCQVHHPRRKTASS